MTAVAWALTSASALAGGPELAGAPPPVPYAVGAPVSGYAYGYQPYTPPAPVQAPVPQYRGDRYGAESAYPAPGQAYAWAGGYGYGAYSSGFVGYDQAVYAAQGQARYQDDYAPPPPAYEFRGYDQAVYAAEGEARYLAGSAIPAPAEACPHHRGERVVHCEYRPYAPAPQDLRVSGPFDGGVGVVPAGGWSSGRTVVVAQSGARASSYAYASASSRATVYGGYSRAGGCNCRGR